MLALADQGGAGQHDGQQRHLVDDFHERTEPGPVELVIETRMQVQADRRGHGRHPVAHGVAVDLGHDDGLDVAAAGESLGHAGGIDVELDGRAAPRQHVALEVRRDVEREGVHLGIHARVHFGPGDQIGRHEIR